MYSVSGTICESSTEYIELDNVSLNGSKISKKLYIVVNNNFEIDTIVKGRMLLNFVANNPNIDMRLRHCSVNYFATATANSGEIEVVGHTKTLNGFFKGIRKTLQDKLEDLFGANSNIISLILLAKASSEIDYDTLSNIRNSGIAHLFALSGLHIAIFAWVLMLVLKRLPPLVKYSILTVFLVVYTAVAGFPPSLVRSQIMSLFIFSADVFTRRNDTLTSLSASLILMLFINPFQIFSVGLLLSFFAVLGLLLLTNPLQALLAPFLDRKLSTTILSTVSATLCTFPISAYFFKSVQVYSIITNIIAIPISSVSLIAAFIGTLVGFVSETLAFPFVFVANTTMDAVLIVSDGIAKMPFATVAVDSMPIFSVVFFYLAMFAVSDYFIVDTNILVDNSKILKYKMKISAMFIGACVFSAAFAWLFV
ncbi:MAG: ComEC/Rec2 family competence protein [Clostridiales bacterium]|nr:ComEC/Rec2 family competence protein [Clostridiales bacterium]